MKTIDDVINRGNVNEWALLDGEIAIPNHGVTFRALHHDGSEEWDDCELVHCIVRRGEQVNAVTITGELPLIPASNQPNGWYEVHGKPTR